MIWLIIVGLALVYWPSFTSPFFQDDFLLLTMARAGNAFIPIANFPYRPLSIQIFYSLGLRLFGENPFGFHLLLFLIFLAAVFFACQLAKKITPRGASLAIVLYAFNVSLFPLFYWVAVSYFVLAAFFIFAGCYFYLEDKRPAFFVSLGMFVLGLLSNEIVLIMPVLLLLLKAHRRILPFLLIDFGYLVWRLLMSPFPKAVDYTLDFSLKFFSTARWYLLRIFDLPEGRAAAGPVIYAGFALLLLLTLLSLRPLPYRRLFFALAWFFFGALPFFFLPNHMSAYYLTISLFGPAVFLGEVLSRRRLVGVSFAVIYIIMSVVGLRALSQTHWIILK